MNSYKVEFTESRRYVFDATAENEDEAVDIARKAYTHSTEFGMLHYHESRDPEEEVTVYDVTGTDDAL